MCQCYNFIILVNSYNAGELTKLLDLVLVPLIMISQVQLQYPTCLIGQKMLVLLLKNNFAPQFLLNLLTKKRMVSIFKNHHYLSSISKNIFTLFNGYCALCRKAALARQQESTSSHIKAVHGLLVSKTNVYVLSTNILKLIQS